MKNDVINHKIKNIYNYFMIIFYDYSSINDTH